jgi:tyrosine-protein kinase Etk/Wzc
VIREKQNPMLTEPLLSEQKEISPPLSPPQLTADKEQISLLDLSIVIAERKALILNTVLVCATLGILISLLLPIRYQATVAILPPQQNSSLTASLTSQLGNLGGMAALAGGNLGLKSPNDMIVGMLKSRTVEDAMIRNYRLMDEYRSKYLSDARLSLEHHVNVDGSAKDGIIRVTIEDPNRDRAAELANGYVNQFKELSEHLAITEAGQRRLFFQQQLDEAKENLVRAEEDLKRTQQETGLIQLDSQARALIESAASFRAQMAAKEVQIDALRTYATSENAQLILAEKELKGLRAQLAKLGGSQENGDESLILPKGKVPEAGLMYVRRIREVKYRETVFEILARQFELAKLDEARQGALIQVVDAAVPPDRRSSPKRTLIVLGATALGLILGVVLAMIEAQWQRLKQDVETDQKLDVLRKALVFRR